MWHSEEDFIKDLASLNDFGVSGAKETFELLYSKGRATKIQQKPETTKSFVDHRTGDIINIDEIIIDPNIVGNGGGRGRGSTLGSLTKSRLQLQQQLRLARPLGSGDGAIESYCRRKTPNEFSSKNEDGTLSSDYSEEETDQKTKSSPTKEPSASEKEKPIQRVKGTRSSNFQRNALITSLLSKADKPWEQEASGNSTDTKNPDVWQSAGGSAFSEKSKGSPFSYDSSARNLSAENGLESDENDKFEIICSKSSDSYEFGENTSESSSSDKNVIGKKKMYKELGLERFGRNNWEPDEDVICDFGDIMRSISSLQDDSRVERFHYTEPEVGFVHRDSDFPPLRRK